MDTTRQGESGKNWESSIETYTLPCVKLILLNCGAGETLESPLDCKEMKPVSPKGNQSWTFTGRIDAKADAPIFWSLDEKSQLTGKDPDAG